MTHQTGLVVKDILAAVGDVLLRWGLLETVMFDVVGEAPSDGLIKGWLAVTRTRSEVLSGIRKASEVRHLLMLAQQMVKSRALSAVLQMEPVSISRCDSSTKRRRSWISFG
jgi:hypothetical protein